MRVASFIVGLLLCLIPQAARAAVSPDQLYGGLLVGSAVSLDYALPTQLKVTQVVGARLEDSADGLVAQLELSESVGNYAFVFQVTPRAGYGVTLVEAKDLEVVVVPNLGMGLALADRFGAFTLQPAVDLHVWLDDDWNVVVRPLAVDLFASRTLSTRADLLVGLAKRF